MGYEDPYATLGVRKGASKKDVQQAFRDLALKYHPDRDSSTDAAERFQRISRAATVILKEGSLSPGHSGPNTGAAARKAWQEQNQASTARWVRTTRYSYNVAANADDRRDNPTPAQQRINELLYEKRLQKEMEKA